MAARLSGLSKKERIRLLLEKNKIAPETSTETTEIAPVTLAETSSISPEYATETKEPVVEGLPKMTTCDTQNTLIAASSKMVIDENPMQQRGCNTVENPVTQPEPQQPKNAIPSLVAGYGSDFSDSEEESVKDTDEGVSESIVQKESITADVDEFLKEFDTNEERGIDEGRRDLQEIVKPVEDKSGVDSNNEEYEEIDNLENSEMVEGISADGREGMTGIDGKEGIDGKDGIEGIDGISGIDGKEGIEGIGGKDGIEGIGGKDGIEGIDGKEGISGIDGKDGIKGIAQIDCKDAKEGIYGIDGIEIRDEDGITAKDAMLVTDTSGTDAQTVETYIDIDRLMDDIANTDKPSAMVDAEMEDAAEARSSKFNAEEELHSDQKTTDLPDGSKIKSVNNKDAHAVSGKGSWKLIDNIDWANDEKVVVKESGVSSDNRDVDAVPVRGGAGEIVTADQKPVGEVEDKDKSTGKEFSVDIFADESENEDKKCEKDEVCKTEEERELVTQGGKESCENIVEIVEEIEEKVKEIGEKDQGLSEKEETKKESEKEDDGDKEKRQIKLKSKGVDRSKHKDREKDKEREKEKDREKDKDREMDKAEKNKGKKKHRDHKDRKDDRRDKDVRRERSGKKKHKEKAERSDRSSRKSKEKSRSSSTASRRIEEASFTTEELLKREEETKKEIAKEIEREERRRTEYEELKKEELLKEKERKKEVEVKVAEEKKDDAKKKEEVENEMRDFAEMLLEGSFLFGYFLMNSFNCSG